MTSIVPLRRSLLYVFVSLSAIFLLMVGCKSFKKKAESGVLFPGERDRATETLPSEKAAATLIQEGWENMDRGYLLLAEQKFENALRISPTSGEGYLGLASVAHHQQDFQRALEFLQIGEAYSTHLPDLLSRIYLLEGDCYKALGKRKEAQEAYQKAIEVDPDNKTFIER